MAKTQTKAAKGPAAKGKESSRDRRARLDELKRQQRRAERRKTMLFAGAATLVGAIIIGAAVIPAVLHDRAVARAKKVGYVAKPSKAEAAAGCTGTRNMPVSPGGQHVTNPINFSSEPYGIPPTGGQHDPISLGDKVRFYPLSLSPRPERAVHNLEHGYVVAWYDSSLPASSVSVLQSLALNPLYPRLLVVGWTQGALPGGKHLYLTAWARSEGCSSASTGAVKAFYDKQHDNSLSPESGYPPIQGADTIAPNLLVPPPSPSPSPAAKAKAKKK